MLINQKSKVFVAMVAGLLLQPLQASAQWSLDVHGNDIALGMDRQIVLSKLKNYRVQCLDEPNNKVSGCNSLIVQSDRPPYEMHANVFLQNGKVKSVRKYWSRGYEGTEPGKFVQTLYTLLASNSRQSAVQFQVSVAERREPGGIQQTIFLTSGRRTISISYSEGLRGADGAIIPPFVNLDEMVE